MLQSKKKIIKPLVFKYHNNSLHFFHFIYLLCGIGDWAQSLNKFRFLSKCITSVKPWKQDELLSLEFLSLAAQGKVECGGTHLYTSAIPVPRRLGQEDQHGFKASLAYVARLISKTKQPVTANEQLGRILLITRLLCIGVKTRSNWPSGYPFHFGFNALPTSIPDSYRNERQTLCACGNTFPLRDCLQKIPTDDWMGFCVQNASSLPTKE